MNYIELFAGCGGLSLGLETAGFDLIFANELSPMASETFAYNLLNADLVGQENVDKILWVSSTHSRLKPEARLRENPQIAVGLKDCHYSEIKNKKLTKDQLSGSLLVGSIVDINTILDDENYPLYDILTDQIEGGVDVVSGGPPCQSFSLAGLRDHSNHRNALPGEFAKFVGKIKPKIALLENVSGILRPFKIDGMPYYAWFEVAKAFAEVGYIPLCLHVNAKYVGTAQNRPRFILIGLREDIYLKIRTNTKDEELLAALAPSQALFDCISSGKDPHYGSLPYFDSEKRNGLFGSRIFSDLVAYQGDQLVTVKEAIDDLLESTTSSTTSEYVDRINTIFGKPDEPSADKFVNHDYRSNSPRVKSRFRLYQIMSNIEIPASKEISRYLGTEGSSGISAATLIAIKKHWILDLDGNKISAPKEHEILFLLSSLFTKKRTQKALRANYPAPATLSIPDDACHYHESPEAQRTLTVREMARIQSFPDWYKIKSKVTTGGEMRKFEVPQYTQIGNAVPPLLGFSLGKICKRLIDLSDGKFND